MKMNKFLQSKVLMNQIKNNQLSNSFGLISISLSNLSKSENKDINKLISVIKRISQELKVIESKYYNKKIEEKTFKKHIKLYIKLTNKLILEVKKIHSRKVPLIINNLNKTLDKLNRVDDLLN